jgi:glutaredoxin
MQKQRLVTSILVLVIVGLLAIIVLGSKGKSNDTARMKNNQSLPETVEINKKIPIFFYGNTCPHCADVERWMEENKIEEKIEIVKKEVYDNKTNAEELVKSAKSCGLDTSAIGVPFLYTPEGKCLIGTPDIENYLKAKAGLLEENQATESGGNK